VRGHGGCVEKEPRPDAGLGLDVQAGFVILPKDLNVPIAREYIGVGCVEFMAQVHTKVFFRRKKNYIR
jgi:hypothetical protein